MTNLLLIELITHKFTSITFFFCTIIMYGHMRYNMSMEMSYCFASLTRYTTLPYKYYQISMFIVEDVISLSDQWSNIRKLTRIKLGHWVTVNFGTYKDMVWLIGSTRHNDISCIIAIDIVRFSFCTKWTISSLLSMLDQFSICSYLHPQANQN